MWENRKNTHIQNLLLKNSLLSAPEVVGTSVTNKSRFQDTPHTIRTNALV